jgi:hypothetical protein
LRYGRRRAGGLARRRRRRGSNCARSSSTETTGLDPNDGHRIVEIAASS